MGTVGGILLIGGAILAILGFCVKIIAIAIVGVVAFIIGIIVMMISNHVDSEADKKRINEIWDNKKIQNQKEIAEYLNWINSNYKISRFIAFHENFDWDKNKVVAIDNDKEVIIFGRKVIDFKKILQVEIKTSTSQKTTTNIQKQNATGRAVVGGLIAGETGAIVGALSAKETSVSNTTINIKTEGVIIYLSDIIEPVFQYNSLNDKENREIYSTILAIIANNNKAEKSN